VQESDRLISRTRTGNTDYSIIYKTRKMFTKMSVKTKSMGKNHLRYLLIPKWECNNDIVAYLLHAKQLSNRISRC
jgi:hypothetical protein